MLTTKNNMGYSSILKKLQFSKPQRTVVALLLMSQQKKQARQAKIVLRVKIGFITESEISQGEGFSYIKRTFDWYDIAIKAQGTKAGIMKHYRTWKATKKVLNLKGLWITILILYDTSETPLACLYACQNLAFISSMYPFPVWMFTWLKGAQIGTVSTSPLVFQKHFSVIWKSSPIASAQVSHHPIFLAKVNWSEQFERGKEILNKLKRLLLCIPPCN